jgi:hypothetical protein
MEIRLVLLIVLVPMFVIIIMESSLNYAHALNNKTSVDFASVETLGKTYSLELDYTVYPKTHQIIKNENAVDEIINASRRTPVRGVFNSPDQGAIGDFDAFLIKQNRIAVNYENGTIEFNNQHHLVNLECNFNSTDEGCQTFYGEFPYRDEPTEYMLVLVAYHNDYIKYYISKTNLG